MQVISLVYSIDGPRVGGRVATNMVSRWSENIVIDKQSKGFIPEKGLFAD
jgi:hypothetical protein